MGKDIGEVELRADALSAAVEWDDGNGVLAQFGRSGSVDTAETRDVLLDGLRSALADAENRAVGMENDPVWEQDCERLRLAIRIAETVELPEAAHVRRAC